MPNPAMIDDLEARWRPLAGQERVNGETFLGDAWSLLLRLMKAQDCDLEQMLVDDPTLLNDVVRTICAAVLRVLKNPEGKRQESIDDYSWTRDEASSSGLLHFSDSELNSLVPGTGGAGGVFSINMLAGWSLDD